MSYASESFSDVAVRPELHLFSAALDSSGRVSLYGQLDVAGIGALREALDQALLEPGNEIVVDGARLTSIDFFASRELSEYQALAAQSRRRLWLGSLSRELTKVIEGFDLGMLLIRPKLRRRRG